MIDKFSLLQEIIIEQYSEAETNGESGKESYIRLFSLLAYLQKLSDAVDMRNSGCTTITGMPQKLPEFVTIHQM